MGRLAGAGGVGGGWAGEVGGWVGKVGGCSKAARGKRLDVGYTSVTQSGH